MTRSARRAMLDTSRSFRLAAAAAVALLALASGCTDDTYGPGTLRTGRVAIAPDFGVLQVDVVDIARGRFVLTRIPGGAVAADTVIDIAPDADSVAIGILVPVLTPGETFNLTIRLIDTAGDTAFAAGPIEVSPSTSGTPVPVEAPFAYVGTGFNAERVIISSPDTSTFTGESVLLTAVAVDSNETPIPGTPIGWESLDTARVRVTTDAQDRGVAVGGSQRGVARIVAVLATGQRDTVLIANQPLPTTLAAESGNNQSGGAGGTLSQPLVARVTAADGSGVRGLWVRFAVTSGGGSLSANSVLTDSTGRASVSWTLVRSFQPNVVTATTARLGTASAVFNATLVFEQPATLQIVAGNAQTAAVGTAVAVAPQVRVLDAQGLPVPGVAVTFSVTGGAGIVAGGTPVTDTLGLAAVTSWTLGTTAGNNTLSATVNTLTATFTATGIAGPATRLAFTGHPSTVTQDSVIRPPVVVTAYDAFGNLAASYGAAVQVALLDNPGNATLSGSLTRSAVAGVATFDDLRVSAPGAGYTLAATASGLTSDESLVFDVLAPLRQIRWINVEGGTWESAANWDAGRVPTVGDTVTIDLPGSYVVALGTSASVARLVLGGGGSTPTLRIAPVATAVLTVADGLVNASLIELTDQGFPNPTVGLEVTNGVLLNQGTIETGALWGGDRTIAGGITNLGLITVGGANLTVVNGGRTFATDAGALILDPGRTLAVTGGTFTVGGETQIMGTGAIALAAGTALNLASDFLLPVGRTWDLSLAGPTGAVTISGPGTLIVADRLDIGSDIVNAPLDIRGVVSTGYDAVVNGAVTLNTSGLLRLAPVASATLTIAGSLVNSGTIELGDAGFPNPVATLAVGSGTLVNAGTLRTTAVWGGARIVNASLEHRGLVSLATPLTITGQLIVPQDVGDVGVEGNGATLTVAGLDVSWLYFANVPLISTGGTITRFDNVRFDNMATDAVQLTINHPGATTPFTFTGLWFRTMPTTGRYIRANDTNTGDGTPLTIGLVGATPPDGSAFEEQLNGAVINWIIVAGVNSWVGGSGNWTDVGHWSLGRVPIPGDTVRIEQAGDYTVRLNTSATVAKLRIGGVNDIVVLDATSWGLTITDPGPDPGLEILPFGRIVLSESGLLADRITNAGTMTAGGSLIQTSAFTNLGTLEVQWGELVISHPTSYDLQTSGTVQVDDGARLTLSTNGGLTYLGGAIAGGAASTGVIRLSPNVPLVLGANLTYNNLIIESVGGAVLPQVAQQLTVGQFAQFRVGGAGLTRISAPVAVNGVVDIQAGTLELDATAALNATGVLKGVGVLDVTGTTGTGALVGSINPGDQPGALPGILTWVGDFAPDPGAVLDIDLGGYQAGTQHDRLDVVGAVELDGTLRVTLRDGFTPAAGDRFPVMTFTSAASGSAFATLDFPALGALRLDTLTVDGGANPDMLYLVASIAAAPIVFVGDTVGGSSSGLFRVEPDSSGLAKLLDFAPTLDAWPRWAPDRARIVFSYPIAGAGTANALRAITADGSVFVTVASDTSMRRPRFSPNGRHLAFECGDGGYDFGFQAQDVCVIPDVPANVASMSGIGNSDGKRYVTDDVSATLGGSGAFAWNPLNPNQLAVVRDPQLFAGGPFTSEIWLVSFDGTTAQSLTGPIIHNDAPLRIVSMDWAPGGGFIAFEAVNQQSSERAIYRVELASGAITQLTSSGAQSVDDWRPVVSPDDSEILFARAGDGYSLYRIPSGTPNAEVRITPLLNLTTYSNRWDWSPDGAEIVHATDQLSGGTFIARLPRTTTQATYLTDVVVVGRSGAVEDRQPSWRP